MSTVILVQVDAETSALIRDQVPAEDFLALAGPDALLALLARERPRVDGLVLGVDVPDPVRLAQRMHAQDRDVAVLMLADPAQLDHLKQALLFAPFLGEDVRCVPATEGQRLVEVLSEALSHVAQRRRYHTVLAAAGTRVAVAGPVQVRPEHYLDRLLDHAPIGIVTVDGKGVVQAWNRKAQAIFGLSERAVLGTPLLRLFASADQPRLAQLISTATRCAEVMPVELLAREHVDDEARIIEVTAAGVSSRRGEPGAIVLLSDVTARVTAEREREAAVRLRDEFLMIAAHELKTPLTSLVGYAQLLKRRTERDGMLGERNLHAVQAISEQAERLHRLVLALFDLSRIQRGQLTIEREVLDLVPLVKRIVDEIRLQSEVHSVVWQGTDMPIHVLGDAMRLEQVVLNLVQNALKFSPAGGTVDVRLERRGQEAWLSVRDQGIGIPGAALAKLFDRFYQAPNAQTAHIGGVGIGLYVVKEIVSAHGGTVEVESSLGQGSTFHVRLPCLD